MSELLKVVLAGVAYSIVPLVVILRGSVGLIAHNSATADVELLQL